MGQPITNGQPDAGDPAVIALVNANDQVMCTATIIAPHHAITAAHCVDGRDARALRVFVGSSIADGGEFLRVADARIHPGFDPGGRDIAVMTLRDESTVTPVELAATLDSSLVATTFRNVGFGLTAQTAMDSGIKREGTARIAALEAEEFVAVPEPSLSCLGDSGGPALLPSGAIAGVVSRGDAMCRDHAVYSRVDVARPILVDPYLAETAPGAASLGDACLYDAQCGEGTCTATAADPLDFVCAEPEAACAGCATRSDDATSLVVVLLFAIVARRR